MWFTVVGSQGQDRVMDREGIKNWRITGSPPLNQVHNKVLKHFCSSPYNNPLKICIIRPMFDCMLKLKEGHLPE